MSPVTRRRNGIQWRGALVLAVVWVLLWGKLSIATVVFGAVLGVVISWVFPLPPISFHGRVRPLGVLYLGFRLVTDLVVSSFKVIAVVFQFGRKIENAVIRVPLRSHSDLYLTVTAELTCLVPGSVVLESRRSADTVYVHVMDVREPDDLDVAREHTLAAERRVLHAFGSHAELRALRAGEPIPRPDDPRAGRIVESAQGEDPTTDDDPFDSMAAGSRTEENASTEDASPGEDGSSEERASTEATDRGEDS